MPIRMTRPASGFGALGLLLIGAFLAASFNPPEADLEQMALHSVTARGIVATGTPEAVLARPMPSAELYKQGWSGFSNTLEISFGVVFSRGPLSAPTRRSLLRWVPL